MSNKYPGGIITSGANAGYSVAFDGTGDYLTVPANAAFDFGTGDFTIEGWMYLTSASGNYQNIFSFTHAGGTVLVRFGNSAAYNSLFQVAVVASAASNVWSTSSSQTVLLNQWVHFAFTRSGTTARVFLNGILQSIASGTNPVSFTVTSFTDSTNVTSSSTVYIGSDTAPNPYNGYLSNIRVLKGTALYTASFTPPTQLLRITNTSLLTCNSPAIVDQSSNNFTITANGNAAVSTFTPFVGYQGFNPALGAAAPGIWTLNQAQYYQGNRLWPIYDPYFNRTTLLLHGNGTNGAQNNTFIDSSSNNFTITRNGNTTQGSFSPFSQTGWGNYFGGSDYLTVANNAAFSLGSGDATIEAWIYPTTSNQISGIIDKRSNGANYSQFPQIALSSGALIVYVSYSGSSWAVTINGATPTVGAWTHIALVRSGNTWTFYVNGVVSGTPVTTSGSVYSSTDSLSIGASTSTGTNPFVGYISNVRVVKGTAVYTSNFTPPTAPLTAITNTSLLTCQSNRFIDNSVNAFAITVSGTPSVQAFSPFVPTYSTPITYSNLFDGNTDYLSVPNNAAFDFGSGNFTIEMWVYPNAVAPSNGAYIYYKGTGGNFAPILIQQSASGYGINFLSSSAGTSWDLANTSFGTLTANAWNHIAICRSGSNAYCFLNGTLTTTLTNWSTTAVKTDTNPLLIGYGNVANTSYSGGISNLRVVKGTALYTSSFTPPTGPLTNITNTSLLTCQSSTFIDNSSNAFTITPNGNVQPVASPNPFGFNVDQTTMNSAYTPALQGGSGYFDGSGDYLTFPANSAFTGTDTFTIEAFVYPTLLAGNYRAICNKGYDTTGELFFGSDGSTLVVFLNTSSFITGSTALRLNAWNHVALVRNVNSWTVYLNGASIGTGTSSASLTGTGVFSIGGGSGGTYPWFGYISGLRIAKSAVYTGSTYTVPAAPPTTSATNTTFLANFTNAGIVDPTAKNVLETAGNAQISTAQSKFGSSSIYFDGTGDYLNGYRNGEGFYPGTTFTIEMWLRPSTVTGTQTIICFGVNNATNQGFNMYMNNAAIQFDDGNTGGTGTSGGTLVANTWAHVAVVANGSTTRIFVNGILVGTYNAVSLYGAVWPYVTIGIAGSNKSTGTYTGYMADIRVTKGVARYTGNFTPQTSQWQDQ